MSIKNYNEMIKYNNFNDRLSYLKTLPIIDYKNRSLINNFYKSYEWRRTRDFIITRDMGNDLGIFGYEIIGRIIIHHIVPITIGDIQNANKKLFDLNNLICCSIDTHNAIHYGSEPTTYEIKIRKKDDTKLW